MAQEEITLADYYYTYSQPSMVFDVSRQETTGQELAIAENDTMRLTVDKPPDIPSVLTGPGIHPDDVEPPDSHTPTRREYEDDLYTSTRSVLSFRRIWNNMLLLASSRVDERAERAAPQYYWDDPDAYIRAKQRQRQRREETTPTRELATESKVRRPSLKVREMGLDMDLEVDAPDRYKRPLRRLREQQNLTAPIQTPVRELVTDPKLDLTEPVTPPDLFINSRPFVEATTPEGIRPVDALLATAQQVLDASQTNGTVNGKPAVISRYWVKFTPKNSPDDTAQYARLAYNLDPDNSQRDMPSIILSLSKEDFPSVRSTLDTGRFGALSFWKYNGLLHLTACGDLESDVADNPADIDDAETIINGLKDVVEQHASSEEAASIESKKIVAVTRDSHHRARKSPKRSDDDRLPNRDRLINPKLRKGSKRLAMQMVAAAIGAPAVVTTYAVIHMINGIDRSKSSESAQSQAPKGALALHVGQTAVRIPVISGFDTHTAKNGNNVAVSTNASDHDGTLAYDYTTATGNAIPTPANSCDYLDGDLSPNKTYIFTTDPELADEITVSIPDKSKLEVCTDPKVSESNTAQTTGKIFVYQKPSPTWSDYIKATRP